MMLQKRDYKFWFCPGSVDLYGDEEIRIVTEHSRKIVDEMNQSGLVPYEIVLKPTLLTNENIRKTFNAANEDENCAGDFGCGNWRPVWRRHQTAGACGTHRGDHYGLFHPRRHCGGV